MLGLEERGERVGWDTWRSGRWDGLLGRIMHPKLSLRSPEMFRGYLKDRTGPYSLAISTLTLTILSLPPQPTDLDRSPSRGEVKSVLEIQNSAVSVSWRLE